ncbi:MAG: hypothetical protein P8X87_07450 [Candidatus Bathyarchaeota archaeon]
MVMPTMIQNPTPVFLEATMQPIGKSGSTMLTWTDLPCAFIGERINGMGIYNGHTLLGSEMEVVASHGVIILSDAVVDDKMGDLTIVLGVKHWTILSGTEDLVGIHGCGTTEEIGVGTYQIEGQIHFD